MTARATRSSPSRTPLVLGTLLLLTLTLRVPTTAVGPVLPAIAADTQLTPTLLSLLTTGPLLCFVLVAPMVPVLHRRLGLTRVIGIALLGAAAGAFLRSLPGTVMLAGGTLVLGVFVAIASVLAPAVVREVGARKPAFVTALYTAGLSLGPAMAAGLTVPIGAALDSPWRGPLAVWGLVPLLGLASWFVVHRRGGSGAGAPDTSTAAEAADSATAGSEPTPGPKPTAGLGAVLREGSAWLITAYLALTSLAFYTTTTWLPSVLIAGGASSTTAGAVTAVTGIVAIPAAFVVPVLSERPSAARVLRIAAPVPVALGFGLLAVAPGLDLLAAVLLGLGQGASVGVAYTLVVTFARSTSHAAALSSMSQTVGVTLAGLGPVGFGLLQETTGSWQLPLVVFTALALGQCLVGLVLQLRSREPVGAA